jgi:hypothetical protein
MRTRRDWIGSNLLAIALVAGGCGASRPPLQTYELPPLVDLREYPVVGLVEFGSEGAPGIGAQTSAQFLAALQSWQPGVRVLELGSEEALCAALGRDSLSFEAIRAIGDRYGVAAVFTGRVEVGAVTPQVHVARFLQSASVGTEVQAALVARLLETGSGATAWTGSSNAGAQLTRASLGRGHAVFDPGNRDAATAALVRTLVDEVSYDFRPRYERR